MDFSSAKPMKSEKRRCAWLLGLFFLGLFFFSAVASSQEQEFEFDVDAFTRKAFSVDGYVEFRPSISWLNRDSPFYQLKYYDQDQRKTLEEGYLALLADLSYRKGIFEALLEPYLDWILSAFESDTGATIFQGYLSLKPSPSLTVYAGKKTLRWGKGYAWSPTALVERKKNPNEPDLAREGYWMITSDYTKSFDGALRTFSFTPVIMPVSRSLNSTFSEKNGLNFAGKIYLLFLDTDIDLVVLAGKSQSTQFGLDFSRNLRSNWEVHGEIAVIRDLKQTYVADDGQIQKQILDGTSYLLGLRYLSEAETTYILEYYHNGIGFGALQMQNFYSFVDDAYQKYVPLGDETLLKEGTALTSYSGFTPMKDYLFLRIMQKDPFGILYLTPAATAIVNLSDGSASWAPELTYKGFTNFELRLKAAILTGTNREEFRKKRNRFRLELRMRYFF
jgi:hypothetical protein